MDSITLIPPNISPQRRLKIISTTTKKLINLKYQFLATNLSLLFTPIKNILLNTKLKDSENARPLKGRIGQPSDQDYNIYLLKNKRNNCNENFKNINA